MAGAFHSLHALAQPNTVVSKAPVLGVIPALFSQAVQETFRYGGFAMREIPLTQGKVALVDDEDFGFLTQWKWSAHYAAHGHNWYAKRTVYIAGGRWMTVRMHRLIMAAPKGMQVDHWDHDGLNNQRDNLRVCTQSQNQHNQRRHADSATGYKGVWRDGNRWWASIRVNRKGLWLGSFNTPLEAAEAYNEAARQYFGDFACLNVTQ